MGCTTYGIPSSQNFVNLCNCTKGLQPLCKPSVSITPPEIECNYQPYTPETSTLCNIAPPVFDSITDFLINLPILLLFAVSTPARFLYCLAYTFVFNADDFINTLFYYLVYPIIDLITAPILYFTVGFIAGINESSPSTPGLWGYITSII